MSPLACHVLNKISASIVVVPSTESVVTITEAFTQTKSECSDGPTCTAWVHTTNTTVFGAFTLVSHSLVRKFYCKTCLTLTSR